MIGRRFAKYVSQNVLGMLGISLYILADTFFISKAVGTNGIAALNLVLPVYSLIFAFGQMIGIGSAIRFTIAASQGRKDNSLYFGNALFFGTAIGLIFIAIGAFAPDKLLILLGADAEILAAGLNYTRIFMCFAPAFIWNYICNAFVRNDGNPSRAMTATLCSSIFNIVFDYVLMFPLGMKMEGAALATAISPLIGVAICCSHFFSEKSGIKLNFRGISVKKLLLCCQVGFSAFIGEFSSALITLVFNFLILGLTGNVGVAAYGVIANTALVVIAIFNGVAQGSQPLISESYGKGDYKRGRWVMKAAFIIAFAIGLLIFIFSVIFAENIATVFNSENNPVLTEYAAYGIRIYFIGFLFAGINSVGTLALASMEKAKASFWVSILKGLVLILVFAFVMSALLGITGVWLAYPATEAAALAILVIILKKYNS